MVRRGLPVATAVLAAASADDRPGAPTLPTCRTAHPQQDPQSSGCARSPGETRASTRTRWTLRRCRPGETPRRRLARRIRRRQRRPARIRRRTAWRPSCSRSARRATAMRARTGARKKSGPGPPCRVPRILPRALGLPPAHALIALHPSGAIDRPNNPRRRGGGCNFDGASALPPLDATRGARVAHRKPFGRRRHLEGEVLYFRRCNAVYRLSSK